MKRHHPYLGWILDRASPRCIIRRCQVLLTLVVATACAENDEPGPTLEGPLVRDSAGIEIVENASPSWTDGERWSFSTEPLFVIEAFDGGDPGLLDPTSIDVDSRGRIIIGDGNQVGWDAILVYDSLGEFQFQAGGEGEGPGEFGQLWWASAYRGDSLVAFDMAGDGLSIFSPEGDFVRSLRTPQLAVPPGPEGSYGYTGGADAAYLDGHFLAYPMGTLDPGDTPGPAWYRHHLLRLAPDGGTWDTLGVFEISQQYWTGTSQEQYWFAPTAVEVVGASRLYFGRGETFEIGEYDAEGRLRRIIRRAHESRAVTEDLRDQLREWYLARVRSSPEVNDQIFERIRAQVASARFADVLPPYSSLLLDPQGYLWVEEFRWLVPDERPPAPSPTRWSVFDLDGVWLGDVETPAGFILREVDEGRAYGFVIDEYDVKEVHVYGLNRGA